MDTLEIFSVYFEAEIFFDDDDEVNKVETIQVEGFSEICLQGDILRINLKFFCQYGIDLFNNR